MALTVTVDMPLSDRDQLESWLRTPTIPAGLVQRARIVLLAADGHGTGEIVTRTGASKPTVIQWKRRYAEGGVAALDDRPRSGRPKELDDVAIVLATLEPPPERLGVTHWSSRLLGRELGISNVAVANVWREWGLQPWRAETFKFSTDPELDAKVRDVVGLYLNPPDKAVVVCIDEKSQIQALDRTAPPDPQPFPEVRRLHSRDTSEQLVVGQQPESGYHSVLSGPPRSFTLTVAGLAAVVLGLAAVVLGRRVRGPGAASGPLSPPSPRCHRPLRRSPLPSWRTGRPTSGRRSSSRC